MRFLLVSLCLSVFLSILGVSDAFASTKPQARLSTELFHSSPAKADPLAQDELERTAAHLQKLQSKDDPVYRSYLQKSANTLKQILKERRLPTNGRKPDLARRLADADQAELDHDGGSFEQVESPWDDSIVKPRVKYFAGVQLSDIGSEVLGRAGFVNPSPIQAAAIPRLMRGESLILHAETGSGKTLAYVLPTTERDTESYSVILTPTRELAAQVAGIATALTPPGTVRFVARPTNLMSSKDLEETGGRKVEPRIFVGSATAIQESLYGDGKMPASPTPKPLAMDFLRNVRYVVLDEVDRLLGVKKSRSDGKKIHEKPAAILCAAVARLSLGKAQIVAASATVGRPLKREVARVLGLAPQECPEVVRGADVVQETNSRAVSIPDTVENFLLPIDDASPGMILTAAFRLIQTKLKGSEQRTLIVLSRGFGITVNNAVGALKHFKCDPEPKSLLDELEAGGAKDMIEVHQQVSGATEVGQTIGRKTGKGYLFVTGEDTVRGLHFAGLDTVIVLGRPHGPDEYTHIAGRTGRAGNIGSVINVVGNTEAAALRSWERMLDVTFHKYDMSM